MVDGSFPARPPFPQDLRVFHDVARALTSSLDLDSILGAIMQQMEQFFEPESWSLLIVDEEQQNLYRAVAADIASGDRTPGVNGRGHRRLGSSARRSGDRVRTGQRPSFH